MRYSRYHPQQRRQIKRRLARTSATHLRMMIESAKDFAIFSTDAQGIITTWNSGGEQVFGYHEAEIVGQPIDLLYHLEDRQNNVPASEREIALKQGMSLNERWHQRKDGSLFFSNGTLRPMVDGQLHGFVKVIHDMTDRKLMEVAEREQRHLAEALRDTAIAINASLELPKVLDLILENLERVVQHDGANLLLIENNRVTQITSTGYVGLGKFEEAIATLDEPLTDLIHLKIICDSREPLMVQDTDASDQWTNPFAQKKIRSYMGVPIISDGQLLGIISVDCLQPDPFTPEHLERLKIFAIQAAIAIRNARLHQVAQEVAVIDERRRLSRDLHDAISQMLLASSMIAEALPHQINQPEKLTANLAKLQRLNKGAHAELRSLLQDLRLTSISDLSLDDLLHQLAQITMGQSDVKVAITVEQHHLLPPAVHEAFYRICQEALNNVVKHARATEAEIRCECNNNTATISIQDNGRGFDALKIKADSMGVGIMRERARAINATLDMSSQPGQGTRITVQWQA